MKGFRLEAVLRIRQIAEGEARLTLSRALAELAAAEAAVDRLATERHHAEVASRARAARPMLGAELAFESLTMSGLHARAEEAAAAVERCLEQVEQARARLTDATRERKLVENLRDRFAAARRRAASRRAALVALEMSNVRRQRDEEPER